MRENESRKDLYVFIAAVLKEMNEFYSDNWNEGGKKPDKFLIVATTYNQSLRGTDLRNIHCCDKQAVNPNAFKSIRRVIRGFTSINQILYFRNDISIVYLLISDFWVESGLWLMINKLFKTPFTMNEVEEDLKKIKG